MSRYKVKVSRGVAAKVWPDDGVAPWDEAKFGRAWWFWLPKLQTNGGKFKRTDVVTYDVNWLCFWLGIGFWPPGTEDTL